MPEQPREQIVLKVSVTKQFRALLFQLNQGETTLEVVRVWLVGKLNRTDVDRHTLLGEIDAAAQAGLLAPMARSLKKQINTAPPAGSQEQTQLLIERAHSPAAMQTIPVDDNGESSPNVLLWSEKNSIAPNSDAGHDASLIRMLEDGTTQINRTGSTAEHNGSEATVQSWRTGSNLGNEGSGPDRTISMGSVLKQRFELVEPIGEGGMGTVYKARDLLKVEAKDRNPYIAVKLLSGDFRQHPEAFIALQREASKAQRLAHPNIATVYDFDRDGQTVYMTMELMEGEELAKHIKKLPAGGLSVTAAIALIEQLCAGLSYAHKSGLVHADFKPTNAFLYHDGRVKLLDFGIARASQIRHESSEKDADTTLFDPVSLGALTPAYATLEMFEGKPPDPRDDIYALACVAYELLNAKHPFDKLSAVKVKEKNLKPKPLAKLSKRQNRALLGALAEERTTRTATVDQFWDGLKPRKSRTWRFVVAGLVIATVTAVLAYTPLTNYFAHRRHHTLVAALAGDRTQQVTTALKQLRTLTPAARRDLLAAIKEPLISYFEDRAEAAVNADKGRYDFPAAIAIMQRARHYYPDSARIVRIQTSLKTRRSELVNQLTQAFNRDLQSGNIMPARGQDITDVIDKLSAAAPHSPLRHDPRLSADYAKLAGVALKNANNRGAEHILQRGLAYAPSDPELQNLADQMQQKARQAAAARRVADLEAKIRTQSAQLTTLADYQKIHDKLVKLSRLDPDNGVLAQLEKPLQAVVTNALAHDIDAQHWSDAETTLRNFASFLTLRQLLKSRSALSNAEIAAGYQPPSMRTRLAKIDSRRDKIRRLLNAPQFNLAWRAALRNNFKQLIALKQTGETWLGPLRSKIAQTYTARAKRMLKARRFNAAEISLKHAHSFAPHAAVLATTRRKLQAARRRFAKAQRKRLQAAHIEALKNQLKTQANAGEISNAKRTLHTLADVLKPNADYLQSTGPKIIARGYLQLAQARAGNRDYQGAAKLASAGLEFAPMLRRLKTAYHDYRRKAQWARLLQRASSTSSNELADLKREFNRISAHSPARRDSLKSALLKHIATRIKQLEKRSSIGAQRLLKAAKQQFPSSPILAGITLAMPAQSTSAGQAPRQAADGSRPCTAALAGYGRMGRAECFDMLAANTPGPMLVVVPPGGRFKLPFAVGKYEISIGQYNRYCRRTRGCTPLAGDAGLPATGITFKRALGYTTWLTQQTQHRYALPSRAQWQYAARADNPAAVSDFNCRVTFADQTFKGLSLVEIETGKANPWGLVNYVGNAQEWVRAPAGPRAIGGDYQDSLAKCGISLTRHVDSDNSKMTGLRVVRTITR